EAVDGLMVKHFSEGKEVPFFFYGQEYGFCFLEVLATTPFYWVLGPTDFALNLGMLLLFSLGIFYLYRISFHFSKSFIFSSLLSLFMGVFPVWVVWATKARGGYESAFFLAMLSLWLLLVKWKDEKPSIKQGLILGALLGFIWLAQPLWLPGLLPFVVYFFIKDKAWMNFGVSAFVAGVLAWGVKFFLATSDWYKPSKSFGGFEFGNIANLFSWLYDSFTGWFYLDQLLHNPSYQAFTKVEMPPMVNLLAGIGVLLFIALAVMGLIKYKKDNWQFVTGLSLIFSLGIIGIMLKENPRYLLPAAFYLFVAMAIIGSVYVKQKPALANGILTVFILLGIGGVFGFKEYGFQPFHGKVDQREEIQKLARFLKTKNENYAISSGHLLHWQLMFYSQEEVIMRHNSPIDRYPAYPEQIDAHLEKGGVIPMVGFLGLYRGLNQHPKMQEAQQVGKIYFYIPGFDKAFLEQLRYKF
ncbi:MAG: hypothetical protein N4A46_05290, partial [Schleiferiaceae bacterium]|nr:hypothetical protein [Schleiferiaceae bacterium]